MVGGGVCPLSPLESLQPEGGRLVSIMGSSIMATASLHPSDQKQSEHRSPVFGGYFLFVFGFFPLLGCVVFVPATPGALPQLAVTGQRMGVE